MVLDRDRPVAQIVPLSWPTRMIADGDEAGLATRKRRGVTLDGQRALAAECEGFRVLGPWRAGPS